MGRGKEGRRGERRGGEQGRREGEGRPPNVREALTPLPRMTKISTVRRERSMLLGGHHAPIQKGAAPASPKFFGTHLRPNGLTQNDKIGITHVCKGVSRGPILRGWG